MKRSPVPPRPVRSARRPSTPDRARAIAAACARALDAKVAAEIVVLDLRERTSVTDYAVIATGSSWPHLRALTEAAEEAVDRAGGRLHHREGGPASPWILLDCGSVLVHLFDDAARRHYDLERLWADAPRVRWAPST